jgi:hypothetical protein
MEIVKDDVIKLDGLFKMGAHEVFFAACYLKEKDQIRAMKLRMK